MANEKDILDMNLNMIGSVSDQIGLNETTGEYYYSIGLRYGEFQRGLKMIHKYRAWDKSSNF